MTVHDVLKKMEPGQMARIRSDVRGEVSGSAFALHEMISGVMMSLGVDTIRAEDGWIIVEVEEE